ncbi:MAG TPA: hypothetical protein VNI57_06830 [Candidatus Saccharimonadales bacterium]|nr:hypothetical protein [Candidatus Saccharimonadales bacterium]
MGVFAGALLVLLLATGCSHARSPVVAPAPRDQGSLIVYALPFPPEAARLGFEIEGLSAVRDDGTLLPLSLDLADLSSESLSRERRLAEGGLPSGTYSGLSMTVSEATLGGGGGSAELQVPAEPVRIEAPFKADARHAVLLTLGIDYRASVEAGYRFTPRFTAGIPTSPAPDLIGLVSSRSSDTVVLFDKSSGLVAGIVPAGRRPTGITLDSERRRAYVANAGDDTVQAIGLLEENVLDSLILRSDDQPTELALTPDGGTLLCVNSGSDSVSLIDAGTMVETARLPVGSSPAYVLVDREGTRAWVFNSGESTLTVIDIAARAVAGTVATDAGPIRGEFDREGDVLYVAHRSSPNMTLVDPRSLSVTRRVYVGSGATALKVDSSTDRIYLAIRGTDTVDIYDRLSLLPADSIPVDGDVSYMAIDGEGYNLYLVLPAKKEVQVIRLVSKETVARLDAGGNPYGVVLLGER